MIFPKTIQDGQAVIRWNRNGTRDIITGPKTVFTPFVRLEPIRRVTAGETEYLILNFTDGHTEHRTGPCEVWFDPLLYEDITVRKVTTLDAHEAVVIYTESEGQVTHRILRGPATYVPTPTETLHQFHWHGDRGDGVKVPRALNFEKLRVIPDQMYFDVSEVRTADEALITAKLMVFFELIDIERMLQETHDPIADFINALTADVIRFAGAYTFEEFKERAPELNQLRTYTALTEGAERIGYQIKKVVYRGYAATEQLQAMHDHAIETRTRLVLETEIEHQQQELTDLKQAREHERAAEQRHEQERALTHELDQQRQQHEQELAFKAQTQEAERRHQADLLALQEEEWNHLKEQGVDLTAVLVAKEHNPDKTIRLDAGGQTPIHLHEAV